MEFRGIRNAHKRNEFGSPKGALGNPPGVEGAQSAELCFY